MHTIVLVTLDSLARVDLRLGESVEVVRSFRTDRAEHSELGSSVRAAFALGPARCGQVYVLSDEFWSGQVSLGSEVVAAVTVEQLEQTLALEAEYESGMPPFDSRLGHVLLESADGETTWWVTQAESTQVDAVAAAIPDRTGRRATIASLAISSPAREVSDEGTPDSASPDACAAFARTWLTQYLTEERAIPAIELTSATWAQKHSQRFGIAAALAALFVCVALHASGTEQVATAHAELSELVLREKQMRAELAENEEVTRRLREAKQEREAAERVRAQERSELRREQAEYAAIRKRPVQLLHALAATADPRHWIQEIALNGEQVVISGVAVDGIAVTTLAQRLEAELDPTQWLVQAAEISASDATRLVRFQMTLVPLKRKVRLLNVAEMGAADVR